MPGIVVSAGSVNADFEARVEAAPEPGRTSLGRDLLATSGGKAANVAVLAQRLGRSARLVGCVGDDVRADQALAGPLRAGVDVAGVRRTGAPTAVSMIVVAPDGEKTILLAPEANDRWDGSDVARLRHAVADAPDGSVVVLDLEVPVDAVRAGLEAARERALPTVLDPSPASRLGDDLLPLVDHLTPNAGEAAEATGRRVDGPEDAAQAGRLLRERGAGVVYVKLAGGGCCVVDDGEPAVVRAPADLEVVDKTGAGDAFAGALAVAVLEGRAPREAAILAVAASSCAVLRYGSQEAYPDRAALDVMAERVRRATAQR